MSQGISPDLDGWTSVKPIRVAFLVEQSEHSALVFDGIFADCYSRWGGRFSLIVPCLNGAICDDYWPWLEVFDPDVVYSYVELGVKAVLEIHERIAPADYIYARMREPLRLDVHGFRPDFSFRPLSSLSTVFRLGRHRPPSEGPRLKVVDSWHSEDASRLLTDNFGTYFGSAGTGMFPNDARATAGLLTVVSDMHWDNPRSGVPRDLDRVPSELEVLTAFAEKRATSLSVLSATFTSRFELHGNSWSTAFNLVVGDTFEDRLLFWNARLLIPSWLDGDLCCLRVTLGELENESLFALLIKLLNSHNHVTDGSGQPRLAVRSASLSAEALDGVLKKLQKERVWSASGTAEVVPGGHVIPDKDALAHAREMADVSESVIGIARRNDFRWRPLKANPPAIEPEHLDDAPPGQHFTMGLWRQDLGFEYASDQPRSALDNAWMLPKRWRMAQAFNAEFASRSVGQGLPLPARAPRSGRLSVYPGRDRVLKSVTVPTLRDALHRAFCWDAAMRVASQEDPPWPEKKAHWIRPSNEDQHLLGVLGMTGSLVRARRLLLHPFLRDVFAALGGTTNLADADIQSTANALAKRGKGKPTFDFSSEKERDALAALIVKAAQSVKAPKLHVALSDLQERWDAYRKRYWTEHPEKNALSPEDHAAWEGREQHAIQDALGMMRKRRLMFQGYPWTCSVCQHKNWTDFHSLSSSLTCVICRAEEDLPVSVPWHFRPNEFLIESLRSHSVLSLVWVLSALQDRANTSFMYVGPTCFGFSGTYDVAEAEADLLAVVDGQTILCEVKSSWRSLRAADLDSLVDLARRLRPDQTILAVMEDGGNRFDEKIKAVSSTLAAENIKFEVLTPSSYRVDDDTFLI